MNKLYNSIMEPNGKLVLITFTIFLIAIFILLPMMQNDIINNTGSAITPDTSFFYTANDLDVIANSYSSLGIGAYVRTRFTYDLAWPIIYTIFMLASIRLFSRGYSKRTRRIVTLMPIGAFIFDILENTLCSVFMLTYSKKYMPVAMMASYASMIKWTFVFITLTLICITGVYFIIKKIKS